MQLNSCFLDSFTVTSFFGNQEMRDIFNDHQVMQSWLDVEAALAAGQGRLGIIPAGAAEQIVASAAVENLDLAALAATAEDTVHPLVPLVRALVAASGEVAGRYVHWGATTQDVMDTGLVLQMRHALAAVRRQCVELERLIRRLAIRYRDVPMAARTHGQQALPTTFGLRCGVWQSELHRHVARLDALAPRLLVTSFGGAAGTMAGYGTKAFELERLVADRLELGVAPTPWHSAPDNLVECVSVLGLVAATAEKLAGEIYFLSRTEIGEVAEPQSHTQVGSSTMPHKRNPIRCEAVIAASATVRSQVTLATQCMVSQDDRDMGAGMTLWKLVPEVFILVGGALERLLAVFGGLHVDVDRMRANLDITGGLVVSEAVMLALAARLGREQAHELVRAAVAESVSRGRPFGDCLKELPQIREAFDAGAVESLLDPTSYLGQAPALVDRALLGEETP